MQRYILNQRDDAGYRIDVQCECGWIGIRNFAVGRVISADDEISFLKQEDFMMVRGLDLRIYRTES